VLALVRSQALLRRLLVEDHGGEGTTIMRQRSKISELSVALVVLAGLVATGCASDEKDAPRAGRTDVSDTATGSSSIGETPAEETSTPPGEADAALEGSFDVGGHSLFIRCEGEGSPTVLYVHGSIEDPGVVAHANGTGFQRLLASDYRTCVFDRRNVGDSETVDAVQLPADAMADMERLLQAAKVVPPYVLVGASFGGMLSYLYANEHPDEVAGMVLLDAMFPDELALEHLFKPEDKYKAFSADDEAHGLERISHFKVITAGQRYIGKEPDIPVTYFRSMQEGYDTNDYGIPEYDRRIIELQSAYVHRFSPGRVIKVNTPHFMEPVIPDKIAAAVRQVIDEIPR
jgi:pimeloyl-ACP methyl ester carboxylesterase